MKLINLEEAKTFLKSRRFNSETKEGWVLSLSPTVIDELDSLKAIDPIDTIDEIIEREQNLNSIPQSKDMANIRGSGQNLLQELKTRLSLTQK